MEDFKRDIPRIMDEHEKVDDNQFRQIIPLLLKRGLENLDLSMFDEETKVKLLTAAGDEFLKRGKIQDALKIFKYIKNKQKLVDVGDQNFRLGLYKHAIEAYVLAEDYGRLEKAADKCLHEGHLTLLRKAKVRIFKDIHASGHASREDHREFIKMLKPQHIIPSHIDSERAQHMVSLTEEMGYERNKTVHVMEDGKTLNLN